ncbi:energy transducer TonB [Phenylobacterium sp. LjRoot164]|uniref:energy transducer TonB n=1 Tax=unclassified Phenylobacterium TaxID=2640670 RepID=UPI003ECFBC0D
MNRILVTAGLIGLAMSSGAAQAGETVADWLRMPSAEELLSVFPRRAWINNVSGQAILVCRVSEQGALFGCAVDSETPEGQGFGLAALALTPQFLMQPAMTDGRPVVSTVRIPINFKMPASSSARLPEQNEPTRLQALSNVSWVAAPSYSEVVAAYPQVARENRTEGRATLTCRFKREGRLTACQTTVEEPKGQGFAAAARRLSESFVGPSVLADGRKTEGIWTMIPFTFDIDMLDAGKRVIGRPQWAALPTGDQVIAGYPAAAMKANVGAARVVIACDVVEGGQLAGCATQSEEPGGLGFGEAALALAGAFQARPWTAEGLPTVGGRVRIPIRYEFPAEAPPAR